MIRAILFDIDRTLLDRDESFHRFASSQYDRFSHALVHVSRETYIARVIALDDRGRIWKDKVYKTVVGEFALEKVSWQELFDDFESHITDHYIPFPGLHETLDHLKMAGYQLGLITNGRDAFQRRTLQALKIENDFDVILISESEGIRKPDPEIFQRALQRLDCKPEQAVFIGDHPDTDIQGARAIGMRTIWKRNSDFTEPVPADAIFNDLKELPSIIGRFNNQE